MSKLWINILIFFVIVTLHVLRGIVNQEYAPMPKLSQAWKTQPIVSVYIPDAEKAWFCNSDYEYMSIRNDFAISSVSEGPCGCTQNTLSLHSTNAKCPVDLESSDSCTSLSALPEVLSVTYRGGGICIKRGGASAATIQDDKYHSRPHPDYDSACPSGFKVCGDICFPTTTQCPITNVMLLPINETAPIGQGWEPAGAFLDDHSILYVRRDQPNELPLIDIVARLTETTTHNANLRGECYEGPAQVLSQPLVSDPQHRWSYAVDVPPVCDLVDPRYHLFDSVTLENHFLQNLHSVVPSCRTHSLYSVSDANYQRALDPDYLNSGVKCGSDSHYPCVRDPYQRTDCAVGDDICDGVVNQNICGAYARAVRSAFGGSSATLGFYFMREVEWSHHCALSKKYVFQDARRTFDYLGWFYIFLMILAVIFAVNYQEGKRCTGDSKVICTLLILPTYWLVQELRNINIIESGQCTDPFTMDVLLTGLRQRIHVCLLLHLMIVCFLVTLHYLLAKPIRRPLATPSRSSASSTASATRVSARAVPTTAVPRTSSSVTATTSTPTAASVVSYTNASRGGAIPTATTASVVATPVTVQMVNQIRDEVYEPLLQGDNMV